MKLIVTPEINMKNSVPFTPIKMTFNIIYKEGKFELQYESYEEIERLCELNFDEEKSSSSLDNWVGEYTFSEIMDSDQDVLMVMDYYVKIYKEDNQYYGEVRQVGQNCWIENKTKVIGNSEWISLVMDECMNEKSYFQSLKGCVYISFRTDGEKIYTYWGLCESLLKENRESGREYFVKIP